ncbi:hypothetical protein [Methylobacterium sp. CM6257]
MEKSSSKLSYDSTVGADEDHSVETDAAFSRPPEMKPLGEEGTALPPEAQAFIAQCEPGLAERCHASALRILKIEKQTTAGRIKYGLELIERKRELGHGRFETFIGTLDCSKKHVERCMSVARHFGPHHDLMSGVAWSALCELSAKEVSQEVRDEVIARLKAGKHVTRKDIQSLISEASSAMSRPVTKTDRPVLPQTVPSPSEKRPDSPAAVPDRSRAVALLAHSDSSVTGKTNEFTVTMSDVQSPIDWRPDVARSTARAVELLPAPQTNTVPSQEQVDIPAVMHEDLPALASLVQPDGAVAENLAETATSTSEPQMLGRQESGAALLPGKAVELLSGMVTREEALGLYGCWRRTYGEFMRLFGQHYGIAETDADVMTDECEHRGDIG